MLISRTLYEFFEGATSVDEEGTFQDGEGGKTADGGIIRKNSDEKRGSGEMRRHGEDGLRIVEGGEERRLEVRLKAKRHEAEENKQKLPPGLYGDDHGT